MKRVGILLVLAILLLSGCAAGGVGKETVSTAAPEMKEKLESAEASENKRVRVSDPVNEEVNDAVNDKVADSDESTMESTASDSNQLTEQDQQQLKSDLESDTSVVSSQIVDSYSSEARESDEESADRSTEEHPAKEEHQETTDAEETLEEITVTEASESSSEAESEAEDQPEVTEVTEEAEKSDSEILSEPESENEAEEPAFDIDYWIAYAKQYAVDQGLRGGVHGTLAALDERAGNHVGQHFGVDILKGVAVDDGLEHALRPFGILAPVHGALRQGQQMVTGKGFDHLLGVGQGVVFFAEFIGRGGCALCHHVRRFGVGDVHRCLVRKVDDIGDIGADGKPCKAVYQIFQFNALFGVVADAQAPGAAAGGTPAAAFDARWTFAQKDVLKQRHFDVVLGLVIDLFLGAGDLGKGRVRRVPYTACAAAGGAPAAAFSFHCHPQSTEFCPRSPPHGGQGFRVSYPW